MWINSCIDYFVPPVSDSCAAPTLPLIFILFFPILNTSSVSNAAVKSDWQKQGRRGHPINMLMHAGLRDDFNTCVSTSEARCVKWKLRDEEEGDMNALWLYE